MKIRLCSLLLAVAMLFSALGMLSIAVQADGVPEEAYGYALVELGVGKGISLCPEGVYGLDYESCELIEGAVPDGMQWGCAAPSAPTVYGVPTKTGVFQAVFKTVHALGTTIFRLRVTVATEAIESVSEPAIELGKEEDIPFPIDLKGASVEACEVLEGSIPDGMELVWSEHEAPHIHGVATQAVGCQPVVEILLSDGRTIHHRAVISIASVGYSSEMTLKLGVEIAVPFDFEALNIRVDGMEENSGQLPPGVCFSLLDPLGRTRGLEGKPSQLGVFHKKFIMWLDDGTFAIYYLKVTVVVPDFSDVAEKDWFSRAVVWALSQNPPVTSGTDDTHFSPRKTCTRAEVVQFLWNAAGRPDPGVVANPFSDVKGEHWFYDAVMWAVDHGITKGTTPKTFEPNKTCTRAEVVQFLCTTFEGKLTGSKPNPFTDVKSGTWYYPAVMWAIENDVTSGTSASTFSPMKTCTRAEIVTFIWKIMAK